MKLWSLGTVMHLYKLNQTQNVVQVPWMGTKPKPVKQNGHYDKGIQERSGAGRTKDHIRVSLL